jgi:hypothetical protein
MLQPFQFHAGNFAVLCLTGILSTAMSAQQGRSPEFTLVVAKIREHIALMHHQLPSLVCQEDVSQQITDGDKTVESKHYVFSLQAQRRANDSTSQFFDSRQLISATADGKTLDTQKSSHPYIGLHGGLTRDIFILFDAPTTDCYEFTAIKGGESADGNTLALDASLSKNAPPAFCAHLPAELTSAKVWIDLTAFQVVRIEERTGLSREFSTPFARSNGSVESTPVIEYAPVRIHDADYWLPRRKTVKSVKTKGQYVITWASEYSDYHKFETSSTILPVQEQE